jgi:hypothetical protein
MLRCTNKCLWTSLLSNVQTTKMPNVNLKVFAGVFAGSRHASLGELLADVGVLGHLRAVATMVDFNSSKAWAVMCASISLAASKNLEPIRALRATDIGICALERQRRAICTG